jgi:TROVE domain
MPGKFDRNYAETVRNAPASPVPIQTTTGRNEPTRFTHEGGAGWERTPKAELLLLAVSNMVGEDTFYKSGEDRDARFVTLVREVTRAESGFPNWVAEFVPWLRNSANMRSASIVAAVEYGRAGGEHARFVVSSAMARADEPAEALAYWGATGGDVKHPPKWLKRGIADAVPRLYNERSVLKYDSQDASIRMGDVIEICHPSPGISDELHGKMESGARGSFWQYILDRRHGHKTYAYADENPIIFLPTIGARAVLNTIPQAERREWLQRQPMYGAGQLKAAGITWEALSGWLNGPMDAPAWEAVIGSMGYMALLRNLRNFDEAGVSEDVKQQIIAKLTNPKEVASSRQFPIRFLSAYKNIHNDIWRYPLGKALDLTLQNVPSLPGRTLVLVDLSYSMIDKLSQKSTLERWEAASLFGAALALRAEHADLYGYSSEGANAGLRYNNTPSKRWSEIAVYHGASLLPMIEQFHRSPSFNGGTETFQTLHETYRGHDRVILLTDEQAFPSGDYYVGPYQRTFRATPGDPADEIACPIYTFNLAGYKTAHLASGGKRITIGGGLTDAAFGLIETFEKMQQGRWPWE